MSILNLDQFLDNTTTILEDRIVIPPGNSVFFEYARGYDNQPQPSRLEITENPLTGEAVAPQPPTQVGQRRAPAPIEPAPEAIPGGQRHNVTVREGVRAFGGDLNLRSTGIVRPAVVTGWTNARAAIERDGVAATHTGTGSLAELRASGFRFDLPENATITGIKVTVRRSKA